MCQHVAVCAAAAATVATLLALNPHPQNAPAAADHVLQLRLMSRHGNQIKPQVPGR